jgi:hypothetical protein
VKSLAVAAFAVLVVLFAGILTIAIYATVNDEDKESPEIAARMPECRKLMGHLIAISPQSQLDGLPGGARETRIGELVAKLPVEDLEQCAASDIVFPWNWTAFVQAVQAQRMDEFLRTLEVDRKPAAVVCMHGASDPTGVKACVPKHE